MVPLTMRDFSHSVREEYRSGFSVFVHWDLAVEQRIRALALLTPSTNGDESEPRLNPPSYIGFLSVSLFDTIDDCRERIRERLITKANHAIDQELISDVVDALEEIATHYTVYGADLEDFDIAQMDSHTLIFDAEGYVNCTLQYGSDGDVERGDGVRRDDSYPFACKLIADITSPLDVEVQNLHVDNSSFYE